jgi:predicted RecB family nuclease
MTQTTPSLSSNTSTHLLYGGLIALQFDQRRHRYTIEGRPIVSVTGVQAPKPALVAWAANQAADYVRENLRAGKEYTELEVRQLAEGAETAHRKTAKMAADIGTIAHAACERWAKGDREVVVFEPHAARAFAAFVNWSLENEVTFLHSERKVYHLDHDYCGTCDLDCVIRGEHAVVEIKTSKAIYPEYRLQVAAYAKALEREDKAERKVNWVLRLDKESGEFEARSYEADYDYPAFLGLLAYHKWANGLRTRMA